MTYLERKSSGICTRTGCTSECSETSLLCEPHRIDAAARVKRHADRQLLGNRRMLHYGRINGF